MQPQNPWKSAPGRNTLNHYVISKLPLTTVSTRKKTENSSNSLGFTVDVTTNKHQAKQAVKELCGQGQHSDQA
jgi:large subunit ribosomal protein L23Ae